MNRNESLRRIASTPEQPGRLSLIQEQKDDPNNGGSFANRYPKNFRRTVAAFLVGLGAAAGATVMHFVDQRSESNAARAAVIAREPWCEVPANEGGIDYTLGKMGTNPGSTEVRVIAPDGKVSDPLQDAKLYYGQEIPGDYIIAANHIGVSACAAVGDGAESAKHPHLTAELKTAG